MNVKAAIVLGALTLASSTLARASSDPEKLFQTALSLVSYAQISNVGAADDDCPDAGFEIYDINVIVDTEIMPVAESMKTSQVQGVVPPQRLRRMVMAFANGRLPDGASAAEQSYRSIKKQSVAVSGGESCEAASAIVRGEVASQLSAIRALAQRYP